MAGRATTKKDTAAPLPEHVLAFLKDGGWVPEGDLRRKPTVDTQWIHQVKSRGQALPGREACEFEKRARESAKDVMPEGDIDELGPKVDSPLAEATADELEQAGWQPSDSDAGWQPPATIESPADLPLAGDEDAWLNDPHIPTEPSPASISAYARTDREGDAEARLRDAAQADADARARAQERAEEAQTEGFAHDGIGGVVQWVCYGLGCGLAVRYTKDCKCRVCTAITNAKGSCPKCGTASPHSTVDHARP